MSKLLNTINARIEKLAASERITKAELSALSREVLQYTLEQWDSQVINRLNAVLTPINKKTSVLFFKAFTPFAFDEQTKAFGAIKNKKAKAQALESINTFLASGADIWEWASVNVEVEAKKPNYIQNISKNVKGAIEAGNDRRAIIEAVFAGGVTVAELQTILLAAADTEEDTNEAAA